MKQRLSRRGVLKSGLVGAGTLAALGSGGRAGALTVPPAPTGPGRLEDIEHVIIWLQENRSFDHYFGTYPDVRGFADRTAQPGVFQQADPRGPNGVMQPFRFDTQVSADKGMCFPDVGHSYGTQHDAWNGGAMDKWGAAHTGDKGVMYMGYYTRSDMPYYYALADAFTLCDAYHCSVLGPTTPNRLYAMTGMIDPDGRYGGPVEGTQSLQSALSRTPIGLYSDSWRTYPEELLDAGVSWRVYSTPDGDDQYNPLLLFPQYYPKNYTAGSPEFIRSTELAAGVNSDPEFPSRFLADAARGDLPAVSWIVPPAYQSEHPSFAVQDGENLISTVVAALMQSPVWDKTALIITYDENGGFFDHVPPPTPAAGTAGEFPSGDSRPIGMGFRVPAIIVSPFTQGGFVCRDTFDHTSLLQFLERRFGVKSPYISDWRRANAGDLTSAFNFAGPNYTAPPTTGALKPVGPTSPVSNPECPVEEATSTAYTVPTDTTPGVPAQEAGSRPSPSGIVDTEGGALPESPLPAAEVAVGLAAAVGVAALVRLRERTTTD